MCYNEANMGYHSQIFIKKGNPKMKKLIAILLSAAMLVAMFAIVVSADETNLALNKSYDAKGYVIAAGEWPANYTANLTDGEAANELDFTNVSWFAFCSSESDNGLNAPDGVGAVTIDLGAASNIAAIKVHAFNADVAQGSGIKAPAKMEAYVDGVKLGALTPASTAADTATWWTLEAPAKGQNVKIEVTLDGIFAFINEIEVIEGAEVVEDPSTSEPETSEPSTSEPEVSEPDVDVDLGEENAEAAFDMEISVPDYKAGEEVVVTVTVNNITAETGLQHVHGNLYFDTDMLGFSFDLKENKELKNTFAGYNEWEDFTKLAIDEEGNWYVAVDAATAGIEDEESGEFIFSDAKEDGVLVFNIKFIAKADAKGSTAVYIPHASVAGDWVDPETYETTTYTGNGSDATIKEAVDAPVESEPSVEPSVPTEDETPATGDASSMIFFAIIALVAIAGSAVVIKTRK